MRKTNRSPYRNFENALEKLDTLPTPLCKALGYSDNAWNGWKVSGEMPQVAALACEGLIRRNGQRVKDKKTLVVKCPSHQTTPLLQVLEAFGCDYTEV